jgi:hypothetical protein
MKKHKFSAIIHSTSKGGAFVKIPFDVEKEMNSNRPKIKAIFEGKQDYRGTLVRMKTDYDVLIVKKDVRAAVDKKVSEEIAVEIWLDTEARIVEVPSQLKESFKTEKKAAAFFQSLSYTCQKEYATYITDAKREAIKDRRAIKALEMLNDGLGSLS